MSNSVLKILYGPPGTGKTWKAARDAVIAIDPHGYAAAISGAEPDKAVMELHDRLVRSDRIMWVTFHPSYSYEDFVEGYRPTTDDKGNLRYKVVDGPFKKLCEIARGDIDLQVGEMLTTANGANYGEIIEKDQGGWVVKVTPERSDQVSVEMLKYVDRHTLIRVIAAGLPPTIFSIPGKPLLDIDQYGLDPNDPSLPEIDLEKGESTDQRIGSNIRRIVGSKLKLSSSDLANSSHYGAVLRRLIDLDNANQKLPVVIVIDEINRADLSRVFGELMTLIELDKREGMLEERRITLPYSNDKFSIPANLSLIGTMNSVDRSLSAMDFAMRRRFEFELVDVSPELCPGNYGGINLANILRNINSRLDILLGKEYRIGHSIFMLQPLNAIEIRNNWIDTDSRYRSIAYVFRTRIIPLILEYFRDDWQKTEAVSAYSTYQGVDYKLFSATKINSRLAELLPDEFELEERVSHDMESWWDPHSDNWDSERFKNFLLGLGNLIV